MSGFDQDQVESHEDLAQLRDVATANRRAQAALTERVKEPSAAPLS